MTDQPKPANDMRELYAVQHAITDAGGMLTPAVHKALDALRETWDRELRRAQAEEQPETPLEKRLRFSERRNDELRTECLRRGKAKLEYAEKIRELEKQLDEVRTQLGAEILRAGQAEGELRRMAAEAQQQEAPATLSGRVARAVAEDASALRMDLYDDLATFARETGNPGLQHAQIRDRLAEFLFEGLLRRAVTEPAAEAQQQPDTETPASTAPLAAGLPLVKGNCPACRSASLFLGSGGYVTCARLDCPEPDAATTVLEQPAAADIGEEADVIRLDEDGRDVETGHEPGCASQSYPDPGICYYEEADRG